MCIRGFNSDDRSDAEIEAAIDEEIAHHLGSRARELVAQGIKPEEALERAHEKFGDVARIRRECSRIDRRERIMLERVNLALMIVMLAVIGVLGVQLWRSGRSHRTAMEDIRAQLDAVIAAQEKKDSTGVVYLEGTLARPGVYALPLQGELTIPRVLAAAGVTGGYPEYEITLVRGSSDEISTRTFSYNRLRQHPEESPVLEKNDHLRVEGQGEPAGMRDSHAPPRDVDAILTGAWRQIDAERNEIADGMSITIVSRDEVSNLSGSTLGTLHVPGHEQTIRMKFEVVQPFVRKSHNLELLDHLDNDDYLSHSRYVLHEDDTLEINLSPIAPDDPRLAEPIRFGKVDDAELWREKASEEAAKVKAVTDFLTQVLVTADPRFHETTVHEVLNHATRQIESGAISDPCIIEAVRETIRKARDDHD